MTTFRGRITGYLYLTGPETIAKQTIEYFLNGRKPLLWGLFDEDWV